MATTLAAQLSVIADKSEHSLNLKAQKAKHSKSLIFEPRTAALQNFETIYGICHQGFRELCLLDGRFLEFQNDIFSEQSHETDRSQLTAAQDVELDKRLEAFLGIVGRNLQLAPSIKAVEWLVRKYKIHEKNVSTTLLTFLPYHTLPIFKTLMSILPTKISPEFKFLQPYIRSLTNPPRHIIVQAAAKNNAFTSLFNSYVLNMAKMRCNYSSLTAFWAGIMTESTALRLDRAKSGRKAVQLQNEQDVIIMILPTLEEGLGVRDDKNFRLGCYMLLSVIASKGNLNDKVLTSMMEAVIFGWTSETAVPCMICLSLLAQRRSAKQLTKRITKKLIKDEKFLENLFRISKQQRVDKLAYGLCLSLMERLRKNDDTSGLSFIEKIVQSNLLGDNHIVFIVNSLMSIVHDLDETQTEVRSCLATSIVNLNGLSGHTGSIIRSTISETKIDMEDLELKLHASKRPLLKSENLSDKNLDSPHDVPSTILPNATLLLEKLPTQINDEISFLSSDNSKVYPELYRAFLICTAEPENLIKFDEAPILQKEAAHESPRYLSFYIRTWSTSCLVPAQISALRMATRYLSDNTLEVDFQAFIPYAVAALGDASNKVRNEAVGLLSALRNLYTSAEELKSPKKYPIWGIDNLYGCNQSKALNWLPGEIAAFFVREVMAPVSEEFVLSKNQIESIFRSYLNSNSRQESKNCTPGRLTLSSRIAIMNFFAAQIEHTPFVNVKLKLLTCVNQVRSVGGGFTRTKFLLPALKNWVSQPNFRVTSLCQEENVDITALEEQFLMVIIAKDEEGMTFLLSILNSRNTFQRPKLIEAVFKRIEALWSSLKGDLKREIAENLLVISEPSNNIDGGVKVCEGASDLLHSVPLTTEILSYFLGELHASEKLTDMAPASKRRRTSHGEIIIGQSQDPALFAAIIWKLTFVLQLVDDSEPRKHPELLGPLFNVLAQLQQFKTLVASELAYLQGLVLGSILSILKSYEINQNLKIDCSVMRADLLVDCVQKTTSPKVQNAALLVISSLAHTAPQLVLHSVMPIFTFMGNSILQQNDGYSAHVINQTIREVIPPLIASLRNEKGNSITGTAELLLSFVTAYAHVPSHRRKGLFLSLIQTLGAEDFLFALLAMLIDKYGYSNNLKDFAIEIFQSFSVEVRLQTTIKYIDLIVDIINPKPNYSPLLLSINDEKSKSPYQTALVELSLLPHLLSEKQLVIQTGKILALDDMDASRVRELYSTLLERLLALSDAVKEHKSLHIACGEVLESILGLLSTCEFVKSVEVLLDRPSESLRRKILRSLLVRIENEKSSDAVSRAAMLGFLPQLTAIIRESQDTQYKHIAVACVDKISDKYGKKDLEAVAAAAEIIAGSHCLGQSDVQLKIMALLCLSSLVDILKEGIIGILPIAIPKALEYMEQSIQLEKKAQKLHRACYTFVSALAHHLPYMIPVTHLDKLLEISNSSAGAILDDETIDSRMKFLSLAARQVDPKIMFCSLETHWSQATSLGPLVLRETLHTLRVAIDHHSKNALDLRRQVTIVSGSIFTKDIVNELEFNINQTAIKMIHKLNDATFRPIFTNLLNWTAPEPRGDKMEILLRQYSFYKFATMFFDDLKSIVTSYATLLLENTVEIINSVNPRDEVSKEVWAKVLQTLTKCFKYDQDEFWQSPTYFNAITPALCAQFVHASSLPLTQELIPAIVELASITDSPDHHKQLNTSILKNMRSENASVRLASVICEQNLTERLGEEWMSFLPEMLPFISELQEDDDESVERETHRWIVKIEEVLGESLDSMLQ